MDVFVSLAIMTGYSVDLIGQEIESDCWLIAMIISGVLYCADVTQLRLAKRVVGFALYSTSNRLELSINSNYYKCF